VVPRANLTRATFSNTDFTHARFNNANLTGAQFQNGLFHNANFNGAILLDADLNSADFSGADLSRSQGLQQAQLDTACGDFRTRLPIGLHISPCNEDDINTAGQLDSDINVGIDVALQRIDRAISDVENLIAVTNPNDRVSRARLERIHGDLLQSKSALGG